MENNAEFYLNLAKKHEKGMKKYRLWTLITGPIGMIMLMFAVIVVTGMNFEENVGGVQPDPGLVILMGFFLFIGYVSIIVASGLTCGWIATGIIARVNYNKYNHCQEKTIDNIIIKETTIHEEN